jgi:cell division protease FtsH
MYKSFYIFYTLLFTQLNLLNSFNLITDDNSRILYKYKNYFKHDNYNNLINNIIERKVSKVYIDKNFNELITVDKDVDNSYMNDKDSDLSTSNKDEMDIIYNQDHYHIANINPVLVTNIIDKSSETSTPVIISDLRPNYMIALENGGNLLSTAFSLFIPLLLISSFVSFLSRTSGNNMMFKNNFKPNIKSGQNTPPNMFNQFMPSNNKNSDTDMFQRSNITLNNWAGSPEVIEECREIVHYIENKEIFNRMGAEMPKGILLEGPPGTGKTLLAKAIAGETNSTFISISGSEFVELFVGMGASRVRELFANARNNNPCIIFIDEIDAVARQRGAGINMANDEREQTLNQLLYEMDGFNNNENIVVIAATNRKDVLDQAILRPGRFDRIIRVPLPDKESREKIIGYYLQHKNIENKFNVSTIAEVSDGFSGAQLKNLINEAIILSARNNYTELQEQFIFEAFEKSIVGLIKKNATIAPATQKRVALHESGHSILALLFNETFEFKKASIQPTYNGAGGYTIFNEKPEIREGGLYTKDILKKRLIVSMGGKAAEALYYGNEHVSLGAIEDLRQANKLAKRMIGNFGMGKDLEVFFNEDVSDESNPFLGRALSMGEKYSEHTKYIMDKESLELVQTAYKKAIELLTKNYDKLLHFSDLLINKTLIYKEDIDFF